MTLALYDVPADYSASITPGGSPSDSHDVDAGQNGVLTFSGKSGQRISLNGTNGLTGYVLGCDVNVKILPSRPRRPLSSQTRRCLPPTRAWKATGSSTPCHSRDGNVHDRRGPREPCGGCVTLALYVVPADTAGAMTIGGPAVTVTMSAPGQNGARTFSGKARQQVAARVTSNTFGWLTVRVKTPDGSVLTESPGFRQLQPADANAADHRDLHDRGGS